MKPRRALLSSHKLGLRFAPDPHGQRKGTPLWGRRKARPTMQKVAPLTLKEFWRLWRKEERRERFEIKCAPAKATQAVRRAIERKRDLLDRLRVAGIDASSTLLPPPAHK